MVWSKLIYFPFLGEGRCSELVLVVSESKPACALSMKYQCSEFVPFLFKFLLKTIEVSLDVIGEMCCV